MTISKRYPRRRRRGAVLVFTVLLMVVFVGVLALVVDIGYLANARTELQRSADAVALASCWDFVSGLAVREEPEEAMAGAKAMAMAVAGANKVCRSSSAVLAEDVVFGYVADPYKSGTPVPSDPDLANAVTVRVRRDRLLNGRVPFFFARVFGMSGIDAGAISTAYVVRNIRGFRVPTNGTNLDIVPIAVDEETWNQVMLGVGPDNWTFHDDGTIEAGGDGIVEMNMYPQGTGAPGNRGTIDIGSENNSTSVIARQVTDGVTPMDLAYHGGELVLDEYGKLDLNGDTGISAGIKDELLSIKGEPRIIPIFSEVNGPGDNAIFTIVGWVGIRILDVDLTGSGSNKRVIIQPGPLITPGVIPSDDTPQTSEFVYSTVTLTR